MEDELETTLDRLSLPKDKDLPPIIREIVSNAPCSRKVPSFIASLAPLCALASRIRVKYYHDTTRMHSLLLQVVIEGAQSCGKSFAADIEGLIMNDTLKARDKEQRRLEQEYREKKKRRKANEKLEEEPRTTIRVIPPTISKTVLTKRADFYERILGDTLTFWMFAEELAQVTDAGKQGYSNLRTIMRTAYDLGSLFGIDYASDNSYSAIVDINICSMFCATPAALDEYYDRKAIEGGNITRCIVCQLDDDVESDNEVFIPYSDSQLQSINAILEKMMQDTYTPEGQLQPTKEIDMSWLDNECRRFIKRKAKEYSLSGSEAIKVFRKRASVSAFRATTLCYYLYLLEESLNSQSSAFSNQSSSAPRFKFPYGHTCHIYNLPVLKLLKKGEPLFITEGASDCWAMLSSGHKAVAIPSATLLKPQDLQILSTLNSQLSTVLHMYPDQDEPGERLFLDLRRLLGSPSSIVRHQLPPDYKDYSDYYLSKH